MEKLSDICKITIPKIFESNMCIYVGIFEYICIGINPFVDAGQFVTLIVSIKLNDREIWHRTH